MIDARIVPDDQEDITTGAAVAGMMLNGLGFSERPMSLIPPCFANTPVALLLREGVSAEHCNRFRLGRSLDKVFAYGGDVLVSDSALPVCRQEGIALRFNSLDPTSFSRTRAYEPAPDTQAMALTHGSAKDHRPDVQHAVVAWLVSHDGGVPLCSQRWAGNRYLLADAKVSTEAHAAHLTCWLLLPRLPETLQGTQQVIE